METTVRELREYLTRARLAKSYRDDLLKDLLDPIEAAEHSNAALEDNSEEMFSWHFVMLTKQGA